MLPALVPFWHITLLPEPWAVIGSHTAVVPLLLLHTPQITDYDRVRVRHTMVYEDGDVEIIPLWAPQQLLQVGGGGGGVL
jgi:hypothetical protein